MLQNTTTCHQLSQGATASFPTTDISNSRDSAGSYGPPNKAPSSTQSWQSSFHIIWAGAVFPVWNMLHPETTETYHILCFFPVVGDARARVWRQYLGILLIIGALKTFLRWQVPDSPPSSQGLQHASPFCCPAQLAWCHQWNGSLWLSTGCAHSPNFFIVYYNRGWKSSQCSAAKPSMNTVVCSIWIRIISL